MLTPSHLTAIIAAGRSALRRSTSGAYHPLKAECLRDVAETYARAVLIEDCGHREAMALFVDAEDVLRGRR